jgi:hypothetical protein
MDNFGSYGLGVPSLNFLTSGTPYLYFGSSTGNQWQVVADPVTAGGVCLQAGQRLTNYDTDDNGFALPTPVNKVGTAFRFYSSGGCQRTLMQWRDNSNAVMYRLVNEVNGALTLQGSGVFGGSVLGTTTVPVITFNTWWHIEAFLDYATGVFTLYVEGNQVLRTTFTPPTTGLIYSLGWSTRLGEASPGGVMYTKDFVVYDSSGTVNNTAGCIGPCTVYRLPLISDVSNGWTIVGGTTVNGTIGGEPPNDADYIQAGYGPFPAPAVCGITHLPSNIVGVRGIMSLQRVQKSDAGDANYQLDIVSGTATHTGTTHSVPTSFSYQYDIVELDPATGALWAPIAVNNLNVKIDRTV